MYESTPKTALVTGSAGFIGYHISKSLLDDGWRVVGLDCMSDYYDVSLKKRREDMLLSNKNYVSIHDKIETPNVLMDVFRAEKPDIVIHLAAQAGVRYSIENPRAYLESNINGTFELLEAARAFPPAHMLLASTSSAYGANAEMPYREIDKADHQLSFYAATKKSTENMAHSYSHLFNLPITMFRFFTVYGPWGRPDMALFKFTDNILSQKPIDVYNYGEMSRDFTYIDDLIEGMRLLIDAVPPSDQQSELQTIRNDSLSKVAPYRVVNIGNTKPEKLIYFIEAIEDALGVKAEKNMLPMQAGDVHKTWAECNLLQALTNHKPKTSMKDGITKFISWYLEEYTNGQ